MATEKGLELQVVGGEAQQTIQTEISLLSERRAVVQQENSIREEKVGQT